MQTSWFRGEAPAPCQETTWPILNGDTFMQHKFLVELYYLLAVVLNNTPLMCDTLN